MRPARLWRAVAGPSLVRRLLLAQLGMMVLLWLILIGVLVYQSQHDQSELAADARYAMILQAAAALDGQPVRQRQVLQAIDRYQREADGIEDEPLLRISMLVRQRGQLLYASPGTAPSLRTARQGVIEKVASGGKLWRARTLREPASAIELTLIKPANAVNVLFSFTSHGFLLLPLAISLPFLAVPAWLSLAFALRPWRRLNEEIATRGPSELSDLAFRPAHRELRPLVDSLNALLARLRDSAARERSFIADAAHELRTPLAALRVNVEALQQARHGQDGDLVRAIVRSSERAARVIAQLLALVRADAAAHPPAPIELGPLLQDRLAAFAPLAARSRVEFELDEQAQVQVAGHTDLLISLIDNLIDNAVKYSPLGATVRVRLWRAGSRARLTVEDQGPGIAPALRERVFDRFYRAPDQLQTGSGLGLAIVRANARQHGATVELSDVAAGAGLCVTVTFPLWLQPAFIPPSSGLHPG